VGGGRGWCDRVVDVVKDDSIVPKKRLVPTHSSPTRRTATDVARKDLFISFVRRVGASSLGGTRRIRAMDEEEGSLCAVRFDSS
jgi:hypothetical protein